MNKIAAIGDRESLYAYEIIGADVYTADESNGRQIINFAVKSNYSVILVTEPLYEKLSGYISDIKLHFNGSVTAIPSISKMPVNTYA